MGKRKDVDGVMVKLMVRMLSWVWAFIAVRRRWCQWPSGVSVTRGGGVDGGVGIALHEGELAAG